MENGPFTDDFPHKTSIYNGFPIAMLNYQRVSSFSIYNALVLNVGDHPCGKFFSSWNPCLFFRPQHEPRRPQAEQSHREAVIAKRRTRGSWDVLRTCTTNLFFLNLHTVETFNIHIFIYIYIYIHIYITMIYLY